MLQYTLHLSPRKYLEQTLSKTKCSQVLSSFYLQREYGALKEFTCVKKNNRNVVGNKVHHCISNEKVLHISFAKRLSSLDGSYAPEKPPRSGPLRFRLPLTLSLCTSFKNFDLLYSFYLNSNLITNYSLL